MSADTTLWIIMAACLVIGCPIFVSLGVASTVALLLTNIPMRIVALDMLKVMDMFPLLAVVGRHTLEDMAGAAETSWRSRILAEGIACTPVLRGMMEYQGFMDIWADHLGKAMREWEG